MKRKDLISTLEKAGCALLRHGGRMWVTAAAVLMLGAATPPPPARAQDVAPSGGAALYDEGLRAIREGLPRVAAYKLRAFLQTSPAPAPRRDAVLALVRALLAVPDAPAALTLLDGEYPPGPLNDAAIRFWRGQVQAALGRWSEALENYTAATTPTPPDADLQARARFGQGEAFLALDRASEAAAAFRALRDHPQLGESARLRYAEIALDTHHLKEAASVLLETRPGPSAGQGGNSARPPLAKERAYLLGRLHLERRQPVVAAGVFTRALAHPEGLSERLLVDHYWGWAQSCLDQDNLDTAQDALENLIDRYPRNAFLARTFTWLESLYLRDPAPDLSVPRRWSADPAEPGRQAMARLTVGHLEARAGHHERAEEIFAGFGETFPDHPLRVRALLDLAALRLRLGRPADARRALDLARPLASALPDDATAPAAGAATVPGGSAGGNDGPTAILPTLPLPAASWRTEIDVLDAGISLAQNDGIGAARRFESVAARLGTGPQAEAAAFNAVLGWLRAMDVSRFTAAEAEFAARFPGSRFNAEFPLEEGLARADQAPAIDRSGRQRATACLRQFLRVHPTHPRAVEARIALAELAFERPRQNLAIAWNELSAPELRPVANDAPTPGDLPPNPDAPAAPNAASPAERDRAAYLAIWLADAPAEHDEDRAILLAKKFLSERPNSTLAPAARMKLGEIYFQREDYPDAQTQLELLAENAPDSPLAEPALYLAGMSAMLSASSAGLDKAVTLFAATARRAGPFKLRAWLQQAEVQNRLDKGRDALILYDLVITATANPTTLRDEDLESRCAALCGRGKTRLALASAGGSDAAKLYGDAVRTFDQLAQTPGASLLWRRQALTLKGQALEKLGDPDAALAAYDDALQAPEPLPAAPAGGGNAPAAALPPEWTWFYRAGHDAALLLEGRSQWAAAIAIYKKLAAADGPMKSEFENLLGRRRLEHFVWEE